jgi:prophage antirepressor-like protein
MSLHYQLMMIDIDSSFLFVLQELGKNMDLNDVKPMIAAVCRAEKAVQKLLDTVNESMSINDITDVHQVSVTI